MELETELTQSWSPERSEDWGGLLKGVPVGGGEMRTFSLPVPQDDDGTDISLKDWQLGPSRDLSNSRTVSSIKPFKGSVRTRFTPVEPRLDEVLSSPDHFETPVTTPRISATTSRSSSVSGDHSHHDSDTNGGVDSTINAAATIPPVAFDIPAKDEISTPQPAADQSTSTLRARSLRVSFKDSTKAPNHRHSAPPVVRHRSPLRSRSLLPSKEVKSLQPKWESSTKIRPEKVSSVGSLMKSSPMQASRSKVKRARAAAVAAAPAATSEIEVEAPGELQGSSGYLSEGRYLSEYSGREQSLGREHSLGRDLEFASQRLSRELTMSPIRKDPFFDSGRPVNSLNRSFGGYRNGIVDESGSDDDEDRMKGGMLCGGGLTDTKMSSDFVRLLSKLCRVSVPAPATPSLKVMSKSASARGGRNGRSNIATSLSWDPSVGDNSNSNNNKAAILGRHDSLKLLSERCSNAPTPSYPSHKPRKIRDHEPHIHFYKTISKTLDQKLKS